MKLNIRLLALPMLSLLCAAASLVSRMEAQTPTGTVTGMVRDESGAVIPGATVIVSNDATGIKRTLQSDAAGRYRAPGLDPGHYSVEVQNAGFQTEVRQGVQITVGRGIEIDFSLRVGQISEKAVVTAEAPLVETVTNTLSGLVDEDTIRDLPLNGRSFDHLIALQPGVHWFRTGGHVPTGGLMSEYFTVGGSRALSNQYLVDGTELLGIGGQSILPGGVLGKNMGVDAIQEFNVLLGNYGAAYGKRSGGVVNIVTKPGTNQLHGLLYEFLRNDNFDARNFFDINSQPPEFKRNQFGGSMGGPIRKDQTFFFGTYEGLREVLGLTSRAVVPTDEARTRAVPAIVPYLALYPRANGRDYGDGTAEYNSSPARISSQDFFLGRFDNTFSEKDSLFLRYGYTKSKLRDPELNPLTFTGSNSASHTLTLTEKHATATTLNEARFGFSRARSFSGTQYVIETSPSLEFMQGAGSVGQIDIGLVGAGSAGGAIVRAGNRNAQDRALVINQFEFADQVTHYRGAHALQMGGTIQRIQHNENFQGIPLGTMEFNGLADFLAGRPSRFTGAPPGTGDATKAYRRIYFAGYFQDDWKFRSNLSLNLGLRYEIMTVPTEASGDRISNYRTHFENGNRVVDSRPTLGSPFWQASHKLWSPRVGFSYNPDGEGKMVFRGGFGTFYDQLVSEFRFYTNANLPFFGNLQVNADPARGIFVPFPLGLTGTSLVPLPAPQGVDHELKVPVKLQWNFSIQRQITANSALSVAYLGAHSYNLSRVADFNTPIPTLVNGAKFFAAAPLPRRNPTLGGSQIVMTDTHGFYHGLQADLTQRMSNSLRGKFSYTFSRNIDEASSITGQEALGAPATAQDPENVRDDRGLSSFDARHTFVSNFTYDLPKFASLGSWGGAAARIANGWQFSGIFTTNTGEPFTVLSGFNRSRSQSRSVADRPSLAAGKSNNPVVGAGAGCGVIAPGETLGGPERYYDPCAFVLPDIGTYGNLGRNTLIGPGFISVDFSLVKATSISERFQAEFRAEIFNLLNHANFGLPSNSVLNAPPAATPNLLNYRGAAGTISSTSNTSRQIQFGLKISF